ncbi:MAG: riboflavin kinase / FMN adenylyltransferase [Chloroflexi bacterium]|jgi:riboflavin kinase/FMN adenylyltransferase|nr:MAG: riboflavin kinase / FMN adenylyltransferase [Chloroflexota bacterium]
MKILQELPPAPPPSDTYLTIGVFDGVHRGHQYLLEQVIAQARGANALSGAVTFLNHPRQVLQPAFQAQFLTSVEERLRLLKGAGLDLVAPVTFDLPLSQLSAHDFLDLLMKRLGMRGLVVGPDFALGRGREGSVTRLQELADEMGFRLEVVAPQSLGDVLIRSTTVRQALLEGAVDQARELLGRNFSLDGAVVHGESRGRELGFPTANISISAGRVVPPDGVYATWAIVNGVRLLSATNIGVRPTFGDNDRTVETYILDFDEDLYGRSITIEFVRRLRDELAFVSIEALKEQMSRDVDETRALLIAEGMESSQARQPILPVQG